MSTHISERCPSWVGGIAIHHYGEQPLGAVLQGILPVLWATCEGQLGGLEHQTGKRIVSWVNAATCNKRRASICMTTSAMMQFAVQLR